MPAPTKFPRWATNDVVNPTSGENNVTEPSEAKKDLGWDFKEFPPRQYFNWLGRIIQEWIVWFDSLLDQEVLTTSNVLFNQVTTTTHVVAGGNISAVCGGVSANTLSIGGGGFTVDASGNITTVGTIAGTGDITLISGDFVTNQGVDASTGVFSASLSANAASFGVGAILQINTSGHISTDLVQSNTGAAAQSIKYRTFTDGEDFQDLTSRCTFNGWTSWDVQIFRGIVQGGRVFLEFWLEGDADPAYLLANVELPWDTIDPFGTGSVVYNPIICDPSDNGDGFGTARMGVFANPNLLEFVNGGWGVPLNNWPPTGKKRVAGSISFMAKRGA